MKFYKGLKIKHKMLFTYLGLCLAVLCIFFILSLQKSSEVLRDMVEVSTQRSFDQANQFITYKLNSVKDSSSMLFINSNLKEILGKNMASYPLTEQINDYNKLKSILKEAESNREVFSIRLFVNSEALYAEENRMISSLAKNMDEPWLQKKLESDSLLYCTPAYEYDYKDNRMSQRIITCARALYTNGFNGDVVGVIAIDILEKSMHEILEQTNITDGSKVFIINEDQQIVTTLSPNEDMLSDTLLNKININNNQSREIEHEGKRYLVNQQEIEEVDWRLVAITPISEIDQPIQSLAKYFIWLSLALACMAFLISFWLANGITERISLLVKRIKGFEKENWGQSTHVDSMDELGILQLHINQMAENIQLLIKEKYQAEIHKKNAELTALQAQINPHFLYNTLDLIHWMALKYRATEISSVVSSLANFFKLSLNQGKDIVAIRDELEHVRHYLEIQNKRFSNQIVTTFEIDANLYDVATVKLILQPIVENAILHGIRETRSKTGEIIIRGVKAAEDLVELTVIDNGKGMTEEQLASILKQESSSGYGIRNVNERIKLYFGPHYGLEYWSEPNKGTKVTIRFPALLYSDIIKNNDKKESALQQIQQP